MQEISQLELDLLFLFYTFSDQKGHVDIPKVREWARERMGVFLPNEAFTLEQKHLDILMDKGILPDTRIIFDNVKTIKPKKPKRKT
jgi:hypothetical protein